MPPAKSPVPWRFPPLENLDRDDVPDDHLLDELAQGGSRRPTARCT